MAVVSSTINRGINAKAGFKIETSFGVPVAIGAGDLIHFVSENISLASSMKRINTAVNDSFLIRRSRQHNTSFSVEASYGVIALFYALLGGGFRENTPLQLGATAAYEHFIEPDFDIGNRPEVAWDSSSPSGNVHRHASFVVEKDNIVWEAVSTFLSQFSMEIKKDLVTFDFNGISHSVGHDTAVLSSGTLPTGDILDFNDLTIYLAPRELFTFTPAKTVVLVDSGGTGTLTITAGTYTGHQLAKIIEDEANDDGTLAGKYYVEYIESRKSFYFRADIDFAINVAGTLNSRLGYTSSASAREHWSNRYADPNYQTLATGDEVNILSGSIKFSNKLKSKNDANSMFDGPPSIGGKAEALGSIVIPYYNDDSLMQGASGGTVYSMILEFVGANIAGSNDQTFSIYLPAVVFTKANAPTSEKMYQQSLSFKSISPNANCDLKAFFFEDFHYRSHIDLPSGYVVKCVGMYDALYVGGWHSVSGISGLFQLNADGKTWTNVGGSSDIPGAIQEYAGEVYMAEANGVVRKWDGTTFATSTTSLSGTPADMTVWDDKLWLIMTNGNIYDFDGTTWALDDSSSDDGFQLLVHENVLYALIKVGTSGRVIYENGGSWSVSTIFGPSNPEWMSMAIHLGTIWAIGQNQMRELLGSHTWTNRGIVVDGGYMISWMGKLIIFNENNGAVYIYQENEDDASQIAPTARIWIAHPKIYENRLFIPTDANQTIDYLSPPAFFGVHMINEITTNPL